MSLQDKNVVFVGGLGHIGYEACKVLMQRDWGTLFVLDVLDKPEAIEELQKINPDTKVYYAKFDITNKDSIKKSLEDVASKVKYIDALVNGAGVLTDPNVELTININLIGLINTTLEALQYMDKNKLGRGGIIVNIASVLGLEPCPSAAVYSASKFGVVGFSRSLGTLFVLDVLDKPEAIEELQKINPDTKVYYAKFDITNKDSIKKSLEDVASKVKYIDALVNGAGVLTDTNVELTININLIGLINTTLEALQYMDKNKLGRGGIIVNIASVLGLEPCPSAAVYSASKFGVVGFSRSLGDPHYYEHTGVAVATFCPGLTDTPLKNNIASKYTFDYSKEIAEKMSSAKSQTPEICGQHIAQVIELNDNGAIYISNLETLSKVKPSVYWEPTF